MEPRASIQPCDFCHEDTAVAVSSRRRKGAASLQRARICAKCAREALALLGRVAPAEKQPRAAKPKAGPRVVSTREQLERELGTSEDLTTFATRVLEAAFKTPRRGWFGDSNVFISHLYRQMRPREDLDTFKGRLVEAHKKGLISLTRADLVEAMDPNDVQESETSPPEQPWSRNPYPSVTWHFLRVPQEHARW